MLPPLPPPLLDDVIPLAVMIPKRQKPDVVVDLKHKRQLRG
jgi:hypothetical protein